MRFLSADQISSIEDRHTPHTVTESTTAWSGRIVDMVEDHVVVVEGEEPVVRQYTRHPGAVAVVAMRGEEGAEEILLLRQYRHPVNASLWEIPAGLLDIPGEDSRVAAERELAEDEEATMEYAWVSLSDALDWVLAGRLHNPSTVIGILSAHAARGRGWEGLREPGAPWLR